MPKQVIVVVEDTRPIADLICNTLNEDTRFEAIAVDNGAAAIETLRAVKASLVILDVSLPGISGLEVYDRLRADEATRHIPAVFVTADSQAIRDLEARQIPHVIAKPFDLDELLATVDRALQPPPAGA